MLKPVLGHIDCPTCGASKAMRITHDKNFDPFGFCETGCGQQLRIGGNPARVRAFTNRYSWAVKPVTVTDTEPKTPETATAPPKQVKTDPVSGTGKKNETEHASHAAAPSVPEQKPKKSAFADALNILGVKG